MMKFYIFLLIIGFLGTDLNSCGLSQQPTNVDNKKEAKLSKEVLKKVTKVYKSLDSYEGVGQNQYTSEILGEKENAVFNFTVKYNFPSEMNLEWNFEGQNYEFISEHNYSCILVNKKKEIEFEDGFGILDASNKTRGGGFQVSSILLNRRIKNDLFLQFNNLTDLKLVTQEIIKGKLCYVIRGRHTADELIFHTYWIDKDSYLIRQFESLQRSKINDETFFRVIEKYDEIKIKYRK